MDEVEKLALVDNNDQIIGEILRGDIGGLTQDGGKYVRAVNAFIVRGDGKIWTPTRSTHKKLAPGGLDYSVGAHVQSGEDYLDSLIREFQEEAGIVLDPNRCAEVAYNTPASMNNGSIYFNKLFVVATDDQPKLSDEHTDGEFLEFDEIISRVNAGAATKNWYLEDLASARKYLEKEIS